MERDVSRIIARCRVCHVAKTHHTNAGLYTLLPVPKAPWEDIKRFPAGRFWKLKPHADSPFRVLKQINDNAYKIELPGHYNILATFNVADLSPYIGSSDDETDSQASAFQGEEDNAEAAFQGEEDDAWA
ncbi:hypothetical protein Tco_0089813 [Tanacetum coccineum]